MQIVKGQSVPVETSGTGPTSGFRIETNAYAFQMLSSGVYSDKISAVLREVGCNAADAHTAAGKRDMPFEVKLPTQLDSQFWIRDWGPGLDEDGVRGLYTTYFSSTKRDSNDFTGAFGLGSKSPFSYTDSFVITACQEGIQRTFVAHLDENGSPVITKTGESGASEDWPTGVRISFPVRQADFREFAEKALRVYRWFQPKPAIKGLSLEWPAPEAAWLEDETLTVFEHAPRVRRESVVVMGNVAYPLKIEDVFPERKSSYSFYSVSPDSSSRVEEWVIASGVILKLPIGSVEVAVSREALQFNARTRTALQDALVAAYETVCESGAQRFFAAWKNNTGWARNVAQALEMQRLPTCLKEARGEVLTQRLVDMGVPYDEAYKPTKVLTAAIPTWVDTSKESGLSVKFFPARGHAKAKSYLVHEGHHTMGQDVQGTRLTFHPETTIYIGDVDKAEDRIPAYGNGDALLITQRGKNKAEAERVARQISNEMGGVPLVEASSLPAPEQRAPTDQGKTKVPLLVFGDYSPHRGSDDWKTEARATALDDIPADCRYFLVRDGAPCAGGTLFSLDYLDDDGLLRTHEQVEWWRVAPLLTRWRRVFAEFGIQEQSLPRGFILVPTTAVKRLGLIARGFRPILEPFREVMRGKAFADGLVRRDVAGMPECGNVPKRPAAVFASRYRLDDSGFASALSGLLYPEISSYLGTIKEGRLDTYEVTLRAQLELMIGPLWEFLSLNPDVFTPWEQVEARLEREYPAIKIVNQRMLDSSPIETLLPALQCILARQVKS